MQTTEVLANPTGGVAIVGQASLVNQGNKLTVTTQNGVGTNYSAINWQSFSIPAGSTTFFQQPSATSTSINRVVSNTPSVLFGTLGSNGNLVLVNQSGIAVGAGAVVDTAGFTASSLRMSDADALAGRLLFGDALATGAGLSVQGRILARSGDVVLLGSTVDAGKDALIQAPNGSTILAAGRQIELTGRGLEGISLQVQAPSDQAVNLGMLQGNAVGIFAGTLKHSGLIQATSATLEGGKVILKASGDAYVEGSGTITASGTRGGSVDVLGKRVALTDQAVIDVSGEDGGGTVRVGGDYQGKNPDVPNAQYSYFGPQASIRADATGTGDGGKVIVWSDKSTQAYGSISARGGEESGNGGFVETSGKQNLDFRAQVDLGAGKGHGGTLLLDPDTIYLTGGSGGTGTLSQILFADNPGGPSWIYQSQFEALSAGTDVILEATSYIRSTSSFTTMVFPGNLILRTRNDAGDGAGGIDLSMMGGFGTGSGDAFVYQTAGSYTISMTTGYGATSPQAAPIIVPNLLTGGGGISLSSSGAITLRNTVNAGTGNISLSAAGPVTQLAAITAGGLEIKGGGAFTLTNSANDVARIAIASGAGAVSYTNVNALSVGTVNATTGISRGGDVTLTSSASDISFDSSATPVLVSSTAISPSTLSLNADRDIVFSGASGTTFRSATSTGQFNVELNAPKGEVRTEATSSVTLDGRSIGPYGLTTVTIPAAKTWNNLGTLNVLGKAAVHLGGTATFHNSGGTTNVAGNTGWAFYSTNDEGVISNDGVFNVTASTAFEAAYGQGASGTLNVKDASLNLQNAKTIRGTVDLLPAGAASGSSLSVNEFHSSGASFVNTTFNGGSLTVAGTVGGTPTASFSGVSAPTTELKVGAGSTVPGNVSIVGDSTFSGLNLASGGGTLVAVNNAALGIAGGDFTVPADVSYTGRVGYYAKGSVSLPGTAAIVTSGGDVTLLAGWNGNMANPAVTGVGGVTVADSKIITDGSIILKAGSAGISTSGVGTGGGAEFLQASKIALDSAGGISVGMLSGEVVARATGAEASVSLRSSGDLVVGASALSSVPAGVSSNGGSVELSSDASGKMTVNGPVSGYSVSLDGGSGGISGDALVTGSTLRLQFGGGMGAIGTAAKPLHTSSEGGSGNADISTGNSDGFGSSGVYLDHTGDATLLRIGGDFQNPDRAVSISATGHLTAAGISTGNADLALSAGGRLTIPEMTALSGANVTLVGDLIDISTATYPASVNAGTGLVWLKPATAGRAMDIGAKAGLSNTLELSTAELNVVTAGTLRLGSDTAGDLSISAAIAPAPAAVGALSLASGAGITQVAGATISADSLAVRAMGDVLLTANNAVTNVTASLSGSAPPGFSLKSSGPLNVASTIDGVSSVSTPGMLALISAGALTQSAGALLNATSVYAEGSSVILEEANPPGVLAGRATGTASGDFFSYRSINGISVTTVNDFSGIQTSTPTNGISVVLRSGSAAIGQDAPIDAGNGTKGLKLVTTGPVNLINPANKVGALTAVGVGGLKFSTSGDLRVGVSGTGVSSNGGEPIEINAAGLLSINQPVTAAAGYSGTVRLTGAGVNVNSTVTGPDGVTIDAGAGHLNNSAGSINTTGTISGEVKLVADTMTLAGGSISGGSGVVTLTPSTANRPIVIGSSGTGVLSLLATDLQSVTTTAGLRIGDITSGGDVTVGGAITSADLAGVGGFFGLGSSSGAIAIDNALASPVKVVLRTDGAIRQSEILGGSIVAPALSTQSGTGTTLNGANSVASLAATNSVSGVLSFKDVATDLSLTGGSQTGAGAVTISNTGNVAVSGPFTSDGSMSLSSSGGNVLFASTVAGTNTTKGTLSSSGSVGRVTVQAGGSIKADYSGPAAITAAEVVLKAVNGIQGSCGTSCTNTAGLPVQATYIDISNADTSGTFPQKLATIGATGSVTVKDLDADGKSISVGTSGDVMVSAGGNLAVQDSVVAATGYFTAGTANVSVSSPLALSGAAHFWGDTLNIRETISAATLEFASNNPVTVDSGKTVTSTDTSGTGGISFKAIGTADTTIGTGTGFVVDPATLGATGKTFNAPQFSFGSSANAGAVTVNGVVNLPASDVVLTGASIAINASLSTGGKLDISSTGTVTASAAVSAGSFALNSGTWSQIAATLPAFTAGDFQLAYGSTFIRALGGDGSTGLPYQLADIYGVQGMSSYPLLSKSFVLANNMDATGTASWNSGSGFSGVGSIGGFSGSLNGQSHTISNLSSQVGLFALAGAGSMISNVGLLNTIVTASGSSGGLVIGGLVASNNGGAISNSYVTGSVSGDAIGTGGGVTGGGLVGINQGGGTISNSRASSDVTVTGPSSWVGGLVGVNVNGAISGSFATGTVSGTATTSGSVVGGLIGQHNGGTLSQSYATGSVSGNGAASSVGGLVGVAQGTVSNSYATGSVSGSGTASYIGGLAGVVVGSVDTSYATGSVTWSGSGSYIGGLAGLNNSGTVSNTVWDMQTSGQTTGIGGGSSTTGATGLTTAQTKQKASFASWNAGGVNGIANTGNSGAVWRIYEGHTTPLLTTFLTTYVLAGVPDVVKTYNGSVQSGGNISSAINGVLGVAATGTNAGFYNGYYSSQQGYDLVGGNLTINGAALSAVSMSGTRVYDGTANVAASIFTLSGLLPGETLTLSGTGTVADKNVGVDKPVTLGTLTLGNGTGLASNYTFTGGTQVATITAATISGVSGITAANKVYDGKTSATLNTGAAILAGAISGDALTVTGGVGAFADKNAGLGKVVSITGLRLGGTDAINYTLSSSTASTAADISKLTLGSVSGITAASKVYDANTSATIDTSQATLTGVIGGDVLTVTGGVGAFADKNAGSGKVINITGLGLLGTDAVNYTLSGGTSSTTADISKLTLSGVSGITAANKVYDGKTSATLNTSAAVVAGTLSGDALTVTGATGTFADKNAGLGKVVNITGLGLGGTDAINYTLSSSTASTTADISKLALNGVSGITAASKVYDGSTSASINTSNATLVGAVSGDVLIVTGGIGAFADKNAGSGKVVNITGLGLGGTDAVNYTLSSSASSTLADISKLTLSGVSGITAANKVYDGNTSATINTSHATVVGVIGSDAVTVTGGVGAFADKNAGSGRLVNITGLGLGGTDAINYALGSTTASTTADISKLALSGVSGITVASKVYDGNTSATINTSNAKLAGAVSGDLLTVTGGTGVFADKNAGVGKDVSITGLGLGGSDAINYTLTSSTASGNADISKATITAVGGISISDKVYDGKLTATAVTSGATLAGLVSGDKVSVDSAVAAFTDRNVGVDKPVNITGVTLAGVDAVNYTLASSAGSAKGNITVRPLANWTAAAGGSWSTAGNWDALPDGSNVLGVSIPANVVVTYDAGAGNTSLQAFTGGAGFAISGGSLTLASGLSTPQYNQSGGSLNLGGSLNVNGSFSQSAGSSISATGPVAITQGIGNLAVSAITAPAISLSAPGGNIAQSGALVTSGLLTTQSLTSTSLNDTGNRIGSFKASSTGVGDISLTNVGVLDIEGINTAAGNITVFNTGGVVTQHAVVANGGKVSITANSPLTIGSEGVSATGDIDLMATNLTSAGNLTLNGDLVSSSGAIALSAASDFVQNSSVSAALGLSMNAGGNVTIGPNATSFGNPVHYANHGAELAAPPGSHKSGGTPVDFVATFLTQFQEAITTPALVSVDPLDSSASKEKKTLSVEGEICSR